VRRSRFLGKSTLIQRGKACGGGEEGRNWGGRQGWERLIDRLCKRRRHCIGEGRSGNRFRLHLRQGGRQRVLLLLKQSQLRGRLAEKFTQLLLIISTGQDPATFPAANVIIRNPKALSHIGL
jgi:hypothetical protein